MGPIYNDELYHYGKLGMRWGNKKGGSSTNRSERINVNTKKATSSKKGSKSHSGKNVTESVLEKYKVHYNGLSRSDKIKMGAVAVAVVLASH